MAFVEVEMIADRFNNFVRFMASAGPIPAGILNGLGPDRLISRWTWDSVEMGAELTGFNAPAGSVTGKAKVMLTHVSIAELEADPNAAGASKEATAWIHLSANAVELKLEFLAIDIEGATRQTMPLPIVVNRQRIPVIGPVNPVAVAIFLSDDIGTLRFATRTTDPILSSPLNMLGTTGDAWSIRLSGEFFTEMMLRALQAALTPPPKDTKVEDAATASWGQREDGVWASIGSVGLVQEDKCPGLFGKVDLSVTIDVVLTPSANLAPTPEQLNLNLNLSSDVSDWDSFRCWLGSGGIGAAILGYLGTAMIGPVAGGLGFLTGGIGSLIAIAETVRLGAGKELTGTNVPTFNQIASSSTTATYLNTSNLPVLFTRLPNGTATGTVNAANTGSFGMLISGNVTFLPATHAVSYNPDASSLGATLKNSYSCQGSTWESKAVVQEVLITDMAQVAGGNVGLVPVSVFNSTAARPDHLWTVGKPQPALNQTIKIESTDLIKPGDSGTIYLHTSAGIRKYTIPVLTQPPPPTQLETVAAVAQCQMRTKMFTPRERMEWIVDPPPFDFGYPPLRQWLVSFGKLPQRAKLTIRSLHQEEAVQQVWSLETGQGGEGTIELVTSADEVLALSDHHQLPEEMRLLQRWIVPVQVVEMGEEGQHLMRNGNHLLVRGTKMLFSYDMASGEGHHFPVPNEMQWPTLVGMTYDQEHVYHDQVHGEGAMTVHEEQKENQIPPFSIRLPEGKIATLYGDKLVIGIAWNGNVIHET